MSLELTSKQRVLNALKGEAVDHIPVISVCQYVTYDLMEKTGTAWPEAHSDGEKMATLSAGGASILGLDAVRVPYCQTVEAEALGAEVKSGGKTHIPSIGTHPYKLGEKPTLPEDFLQRGRIPEIIRAIKLLKKKVGDEKLVMGGIVGPYSIATSLIGIPEMLRASYRKPEAVIPFIEVAKKAGQALASAFVEAGADVIVIEDMMASLDMISPKGYRTLVAPYEKELIDVIKVPTILHICGKLDSVMVDIAKTGTTAISVESAFNIPLALEKFKEEGINVPIIGAVHPINALLEGTKENIKEEVEKSIKDGVSIISPGCAVVPNTSVENLITMVKAVSQ